MPGETLDLMIQFALAFARENEDPRDQALCTTELIKYVYLADLAHAERTGETFTGVAWKFARFGPWSAEVSDRLEIATRAAGGVVTPIPSKPAGGQRFHLDDPDLKDRLEKRLPPHVASALKKHIHNFGSQGRNDLLRLVYRTAPMLAAGPGEVLVFEKLPGKPEVLEDRMLTARQVKKLRAKLDEARARRQAKSKLERIAVSTPIHELWAEALGEFQAKSTIDPTFWHSDARKARA